jgi:hypothetical protein
MDPITLPAAAGLVAAITALGFAGLVFLSVVFVGLIWLDGYCLRYLFEYWGSHFKQRQLIINVHPLLLGLLALLLYLVAPIISDLTIIFCAAATVVVSLFMSNQFYVPRGKRSKPLSQTNP